LLPARVFAFRATDLPVAQLIDGRRVFNTAMVDIALVNIGNLFSGLFCANPSESRSSMMPMASIERRVPQ